MESVIDILICPICLDVPKSVPIYQCQNGHLLCSSCRPKVTMCPVCRCKLGEKEKIRSLAAEKLLEEIGHDKDKKCMVVKEKIIIPKEQLNKVVGEGDDTIQMISLVSGIKSMVIFDDQKQDPSTEVQKMTNNKICILHGRQESVDNARAMILETFGIQAYVIIPANQFGIVQDSIAHINKSNDVNCILDNEGTPDYDCVIFGTEKSAENARDMILELIGIPGCVVIPSDQVGHIIGKQGKTIKNICEVSGADCALDRYPPPMSKGINCMIKGKKESVDKAKTMITEKFSVVEFLEIPSHLCGRLIGKDGIHFKNITEATGTKLEVENKAPAEAAIQKCFIKGTCKGVKKAKEMVQERLQAAEAEEDMWIDTDD